MGAVLPSARGLLDDHVNHRPVLGMHADQRAILRGLPHRLENRGIIDHQDVGIGHEQLEAGHTLAHHVVHVFEPRVAKVGHDHVQAVVDASLAVGFFPPRIERRAHLGPTRLNGEVHNRCRPANRSRARARLKIIRGVGPAKRHVEMRMRVDPARQHQQSRSVDHHLRGAGGNGGADFFDNRAINQQIGFYG